MYADIKEKIKELRKYGGLRENLLLTDIENYIDNNKKQQIKIAMDCYYYKREVRHLLNILFNNIKLRKDVKKYYKETLNKLNVWFENQKKIDKSNYIERIK